MHQLTLGILREEKIPTDHRTPFLPEQLNNIVLHFPFVRILVQPSPVRAVADAEYSEAGFQLKEDLSECDILFGIKEIPPALLIPGKTYCFFSHTIKKQARNQELLQTILAKNIRLIDYECLTDDNSNRTVAFGHYAGLVGAYNGLRAFGLRYNLYNLRPAFECEHVSILRDELKKVELPPIKIAVTGRGRVAGGVKEILDWLHFEQVGPQAFLSAEVTAPVFTMLGSGDYYERSDGKPWDTNWFHKNPSAVQGKFLPYAQTADMLMASAFWHPASPVLFTKEDMLDPAFRLKVIADITCDIEGSIPSTLRATTIDAPFYDYNPVDGLEYPAFTHADYLTIMAVDNLPCELPRDASSDFGNQLMKNLLPGLLTKTPSDSVERATIAQDGHLTRPYLYLSDYAGVQEERVF